MSTANGLVITSNIDFAHLYRWRIGAALFCGGAAGAAAIFEIARRHGRWVAAGVASGAVLFFLRAHLAPRRVLKDIPGPKPNFIGGNMRETYDEPNGMVDCCQRWFKEHGPLVRVQIGSQVEVFCADAEAVEQKMSGMEPFLNRPPTPFKTEFSQLLFARDDEWKRMRRTIAPIFSDKHLRDFVEPMEEGLDVFLRVIRQVPPGSSVDIWRSFGRMTMDVIGSSAFGTRLDCQTSNSELSRAAERIFASSFFSRSNASVLLLRAFPYFAPLLIVYLIVLRTFRLGLYKPHKFLDGVIRGMIHKRRAQPVEQRDLLELLLEAQDSETGRWLSDGEVHGNSRVMLLAGYETTANALAYTIFLLAQNPDAEAKMLKEIDCLRKSHTKLSKEDLPDYSYVSWVCNESLRLLPPVPNYSRQASRDVEICGHRIPAGTTLVVSSVAIHRNEKYYPDPLAFKPERWDPAEKEQQERPAGAFLPFGHGARKCVGYRFALQEMQMSLIRLYSEFTFKLSPEMKLPLQFEPGITMSPASGIHVLPCKRTS